MFFIKLGKLSSIIFKNILWAHLSLFSLFGTPTMYMLIFFVVPHKFLRLCLLSLILIFFLFIGMDSHNSLSSRLLVLSFVSSNLLWSSFSEFLFQLLYFSASDFLMTFISLSVVSIEILFSYFIFRHDFL